MYVNSPKKQYFELIKDGTKEELYILVHIMPLVIAVIMPVQIYTNIIFVENNYKIFLRKNVVQYLYFTVLRYLKNWMV